MLQHFFFLQKSQKPITLVTTSLQIADNVNTIDNQALSDYRVSGQHVGPVLNSPDMLCICHY